MTQLKDSLSWYSAFSLVVGSMIGTGVFLKSATMAQWVGSPVGVMAAWVLAGILSLLGALTYSEMGKRYPQVGGEYVYLRESYGPLPAFLYGWTRFWIASTGSVAAYGVGAATFLNGAISLEGLGGKTSAALIFIGLYTVVNCFAVSMGGKVQSIMTSMKIGMVLVLILGLLFFSIGPPSDPFLSLIKPDKSSMFSGLGMAILSALWAFDGWNNLPMAASEVKNSSRNVPRALILGTLLVLILYLSLNWVFFKTLGFTEVLTSNSSRYPDALPLATKAVHHIAGEYSKIIVSCFFVFSSLGAMNGSILTGSRVPFAMAQDGLFFSRFKKLHPKSCVPVFSVATQGVWAMVLAYSGTFDQITDYVIFSSWIFYGAIGLAVFQMKTSLKWIAFTFSLSAMALLVNTIYTSPKETLVGLVFILLGIPFFFGYRKTGIPKTMPS